MSLDSPDRSAMRNASILVLALLVLTGCPDAEEEPHIPEPGPYPEGPPPPEPMPLDTVAVVEEARVLERDIDARADELARRERTVDPPVPGGEPRRIVLWERDGLPVRLEVSEPDDAGRMTAASTYLFDDRTRLRLVHHPYASYVLGDDGQLLVWMDEEGEVLRDIPEADRRARAATLEQEAREYLEEFLVGMD